MAETPSIVDISPKAQETQPTPKQPEQLPAEKKGPIALLKKLIGRVGASTTGIMTSLAQGALTNPESSQQTTPPAEPKKS